MGALNCHYLRLTLVLACAAASNVVAAKPAKFDCDTASGSYSEFDFPQSGSNFHISGSVSAKKYRLNDDWYPVANVRLISADKQSFGGIRLQVPEGSGPAELIVQVKVGGKEYGTSAGFFGKDEVASFSLDVVEGKMTIRTGERAFAGPEIGQDASIQITCSTGEFLFENLTWEVPKPAGT